MSKTARSLSFRISAKISLFFLFLNFRKSLPVSKWNQDFFAVITDFFSFKEMGSTCNVTACALFSYFMVLKTVPIILSCSVALQKISTVTFAWFFSSAPTIHNESWQSILPVCEKTTLLGKGHEISHCHCCLKNSTSNSPRYSSQISRVKTKEKLGKNSN